MSNPIQRQALALAGVFQAAQLVEDLATKNMLEQKALETSINSILITNPETTAEIYGGELSNLKTGIKSLKQLLEKANYNPRVTNYAMGILILYSRLQKDSSMLTAIGQRLEIIQAQAQHFHPTHENILAALAELYQNTLSTLGYRIQVQGEQNILQQQANADKIRALLLAGIRSAMLWQQSGGKRWQLLFMRKKLLEQLNNLPL